MRQGTKRVRRDFPSRSAASAWLTAQTPSTAAGGKMSLAAWFEEWLKRPSRKNIADRTMGSYRWVAEVWTATPLGRRPLNSLTPDLIEEQIDAWTHDGAYARSSIVQLRTVLGTALNLAVRKKKLAVNPVTAVTLADNPGVNRVRQLRISEQLTRDLSDSWLHHPLRGPFELSLHTGMRPAELLGLTWGAIDRKERIVSIRQAVKSKRQPGGTTQWYIGDTKTGESMRDVSYPQTVSSALEAYWTAQGKPGPDAWFVPNPVAAVTELPMLPDQLSKIFRHLVDEGHVGFQPRAKRSQLRLYDLRAIHASLAFARGVAAPLVAARLGHRDIQSTMRRYAGVVTETDKKAADVTRVWPMRPVPATKRKRRTAPAE